MTGSLRVRPAGDAGDAYVRAWWGLDGPGGRGAGVPGRAPLRPPGRGRRTACTPGTLAVQGPDALDPALAPRTFWRALRAQPAGGQDPAAQPAPHRRGGQHLRRRGAVAGPHPPGPADRDPGAGRGAARRPAGGAVRQHPLRRHHAHQLPHRRGPAGPQPAAARRVRPGGPAVPPLRHRAALPHPRRPHHHLVPDLPAAADRSLRAAAVDLPGAGLVAGQHDQLVHVDVAGTGRDPADALGHVLGRSGVTPSYTAAARSASPPKRTRLNSVSTMPGSISLHPHGPAQQLLAQHRHDRPDRELGRVVAGAVGIGLVAGDRPDGHDLAVAAGLQRGQQARIMRTAPSTLVSYMVRHWSSSASATGAQPKAPPALLTSSRHSGHARPTKASTGRRIGDVERGGRGHRSRPPAPRCGRPAGRRPPPRQPSPASARAVAAPMPELAPVTTATRRVS